MKGLGRKQRFDANKGLRIEAVRVSLGEAVKCAVITGNIFTGPAQIDNASKNDVQIGLNGVLALIQRVLAEIDDRTLCESNDQPRYLPLRACRPAKNNKISMIHTTLETLLTLNSYLWRAQYQGIGWG